MPLRIFPVSGGARYTNDWSEPRSGGRSHQGNDLFNAEGTPLLAVDDGTVRFGTDPLGGQVAYLRGLDGTTYYYAHLSGWNGESGRQVRTGEVIGFLGRTGNAISTEPHVHFEVHPGGAGATNPFPILESAERRTVKGPSGGSLLAAVLLASAVGIGAWAYMNPGQAKAIVRRYT